MTDQQVLWQSPDSAVVQPAPPAETEWRISLVKSLIAAVRDVVRTQLWPLPIAGVVIALIVGVFLPHFDVNLDTALPGWLSAVMFSGDASAARTVLDAVSSSLITVTSLTFSLTVVTLQLASSQFSPRLLRTFTRDLFVQGTLALFLATFTYSLTVLRSVHGSTASFGEFVPRISVTVSFVLAIASVIGLVLFLAHLAQQIRVETMLRNVHQDASATVRTALPERDTASNFNPAAPRPPTTAVTLLAPGSGFLVRIEESELRDAAIDADAIVLIDCHAGSSLIEATPLGVAWPRHSITFGDDTLAKLRKRVADAIHTGFERTAAQDVGYGLRQLTDVASKALSPGINDPTTAVHAIGHISALLCELADRRNGPMSLRDDHDDIVVVLDRPELADLIDLAIDQPKRYGAADPQVVGRLFSLLGEVGWRAGIDDRDTITSQVDRLHALVARQDFDQHERGQLADAEQRARQSILRSWEPAP